MEQPERSVEARSAGAGRRRRPGVNASPRPTASPRPSTCRHDWIVADHHYPGGVPHRLRRCEHCGLEQLVRRSDGKIVS